MSTNIVPEYERKRRIACIIYPDAENYNCDEILTNMQVYAKQTDSIMVWILHDKDTTEDGELKKPHYHIVYKFNNPRYIRNIRKQIELPEDVKFIEIEDFDFYILYMLHYENEDPYETQV